MNAMFENISTQLLMGQVLLGLINGSFYAMLSMGLAIIFGLMNVVNFAHGAQYMLGAFVAWILLTTFGVPYWGALVLAPVIVGIFGFHGVPLPSLQARGQWRRCQSRRRR